MVSMKNYVWWELLAFVGGCFFLSCFGVFNSKIVENIIFFGRTLLYFRKKGKGVPCFWLASLFSTRKLETLVSEVGDVRIQHESLGSEMGRDRARDWERSKMIDVEFENGREIQFGLERS